MSPNKGYDCNNKKRRRRRKTQEEKEWLTDTDDDQEWPQKDDDDDESYQPSSDEDIGAASTSSSVKDQEVEDNNNKKRRRRRMSREEKGWLMDTDDDQEWPQKDGNDESYQPSSDEDLDATSSTNTCVNDQEVEDDTNTQHALTHDQIGSVLVTPETATSKSAAAANRTITSRSQDRLLLPSDRRRRWSSLAKRKIVLDDSDDKKHDDDDHDHVHDSELKLSTNNDKASSSAITKNTKNAEDCLQDTDDDDEEEDEKNEKQCPQPITPPTKCRKRRHSPRSSLISSGTASKKQFLTNELKERNSHFWENDENSVQTTTSSSSSCSTTNTKIENCNESASINTTTSKKHKQQDNHQTGVNNKKSSYSSNDYNRFYCCPVCFVECYRRLQHQIKPTNHTAVDEDDDDDEAEEEEVDEEVGVVEEQEEEEEEEDANSEDKNNIDSNHDDFQTNDFEHGLMEVLQCIDPGLYLAATFCFSKIVNVKQHLYKDHGIDIRNCGGCQSAMNDLFHTFHSHQADGLVQRYLQKIRWRPMTGLAFTFDYFSEHEEQFKCLHQNRIQWEKNNSSFPDEAKNEQIAMFYSSFQIRGHRIWKSLQQPYNSGSLSADEYGNDADNGDDEEDEEPIFPDAQDAIEHNLLDRQESEDEEVECVKFFEELCQKHHIKEGHEKEENQNYDEDADDDKTEEDEDEEVSMSTGKNDGGLVDTDDDESDKEEDGNLWVDDKSGLDKNQHPSYFDDAVVDPGEDNEEEEQYEEDQQHNDADDDDEDEETLNISNSRRPGIKHKLAILDDDEG